MKRAVSSLQSLARLNLSAPCRFSSKPKTLQSALRHNPRFEQIDLDAQPVPTPAIQMIDKAPVHLVNKSHVYCDGEGALGHPRIYINLVFI